MYNTSKLMSIHTCTHTNTHTRQGGGDEAKLFGLITLPTKTTAKQKPQSQKPLLN